MAKCIDITEKLSFDKNPALIIKGRKFIVNADAGTMLEIMGFLKKALLIQKRQLRPMKNCSAKKTVMRLKKCVCLSKIL